MSNRPGGGTILAHLRTGALVDFDEQAALWEDRADSTSRSLSHERKILSKLLNTMEDPYE